MIAEIAHVYSYGMVVGLLIFCGMYFSPAGIGFREFIAGKHKDLTRKGVRVSEKKLTAIIVVSFVAFWPIPVLQFLRAATRFFRK